MKTLYGIQYLRAFAALAVVVFHAAEKSGEHFAIGAAGVDVFFVISGFIMWVISERRPMTPQGFLLDRIRRIAPSYWLVTAVMIVGAVAGLFPNLQLTGAHVLASLFFVPADLAEQWRDLAGSRAGMDAEFRDVLLRVVCGRTFPATKLEANLSCRSFSVASSLSA